VECGGMDWIDLDQDKEKWLRHVNALMNHRVPQNTRNFLSSCKPVSFSIQNLLHGVRKQVSNQYMCGYFIMLIERMSNTAALNLPHRFFGPLLFCVFLLLVFYSSMDLVRTWLNFLQPAVLCVLNFLHLPFFTAVREQGRSVTPIMRLLT
jgi:hypothetical protein